MKTALATLTATILLGTATPALAIPDPDPQGFHSGRTSDRIGVSYPFDAGSEPLRHVAGLDWLPARRFG